MALFKKSRNKPLIVAFAFATLFCFKTVAAADPCATLCKGVNQNSNNSVISSAGTRKERLCALCQKCTNPKYKNDWNCKNSDGTQWEPSQVGG